MLEGMVRKRDPRLKLHFAIFITVILIVLSCSAPSNVVTPQEYRMPADLGDPKVSYRDHIKPMMENSCTPCHFPEKGQKKLLNTFEAMVESIDDIIYRVQLPVDSIEYMPYKQKKLPLSTKEIQILKNWYDQGIAR